MIVPSIRKLSEALGVSHTLLNSHLRDGKFTAEPTGGYDVERVRASLAANTPRPRTQVRSIDAPPRDEGDPIAKPPRGTVAYEQYRLTREKADSAELQNKRTAGELMLVSEAEEVRAEMAIKIRDAVLALPTRIVMQLPAEWRRDVSAVVDKEARQLLIAMSDEFRTDTQAA